MSTVVQRVRQSWCARVAHAAQTAGTAIAMVAALTASLSAQVPVGSDAVITDSGRGDVTFVLVSGMMGGVGGYDRVRTRLLASGARVVTIDPYGLSMDSTDVTFAALARRVESVLERRNVGPAVVVGHAHGAGVALRLAARAPRRVSALYLLDAGALPDNRTAVFSTSLRLAPLIARIPGGRGLVRRRILKGIEENSDRDAWFDDATRPKYTERLLDHLSAVVAMASRLADAHEPETVAAVVSHIHVPVTSLLGDVAHPSAPDAEELRALAPLGPLLRVEHLSGVGHFPHEEVPDAVVSHLLAGATADQRRAAVRVTDERGRIVSPTATALQRDASARTAPPPPGCEPSYLTQFVFVRSTTRCFATPAAGRSQIVP